MMVMCHCTETWFNYSLTVLWPQEYPSRRFLVGSELCVMMQREPYNLYRSMLIRKVPMHRCEPMEIQSLVHFGIVQPGIHSVTLVNFSEGIEFIRKQLAKPPRTRPAPRTAKVDMELEVTAFLLVNLKYGVVG
jgi:hypothetical protein